VPLPSLPFAPQVSPADVAGFLCVFVRGCAFLIAAPLVGEKQLPAKVRVAAAAAIAFAVAPVRGPLDPAQLPLVVPGDVLLGLAAGFVGRVVMAGIEAGGELMGLSLGLGFAATYDPMLQAQAVPTQRIAAMLGGLAFFSAGGLEAGVHVIAGPPVSGLSLVAAVGSILHHSGEILVVGLRFAAPLLIATTVANLAVALAARAAPAINVFSVMLALVVLLGGAVLYATAPSLVRETMGGGRRAAEAMQATVRP
jgi:flagellar biosynthetic protein FliR